jgi:hypothetical protein
VITFAGRLDRAVPRCLVRRVEQCADFGGRRVGDVGALVSLRQVQLLRSDALGVGDEGQPQQPAVSVGGEGLRAGAELACQSGREERLQRGASNVMAAA